MKNRKISTHARQPPMQQTGCSLTDLFAKALSQHLAGNLLGAQTLYEKILTFDPRHTDCLTNLGTIYLLLGHTKEAVKQIGRSLAINSNQPIAWNNRGIALQGLNRYQDALESYDRALFIKPNYAEAYINRGDLLHEMGRLDEANANYDQAISLQPNNAVVYYNRGNCLKSLNRLDEALTSYDHALALQPDNFEAQINRGVVLLDQKRWNEALTGFDYALIVKPDSSYAHGNRGIALQNLNRLEEALTSYAQSLAINPDNAEANNSQGHLLHKLNRNVEAMMHYARAMALKPAMPYVPGLWYLSKMHCCDWKNLKEDCARIVSAVERDEDVTDPLAFLVIPHTSSLQQRCARLYSRHNYPVSDFPLWHGEHYAHERIKVGYFSADFRDHPVSHLLAHLIECHDRSKFEIIGFSLGPPTQDVWRQRLEKAFDRFFDVSVQPDREIAALARELEIDIAIDLNGHTQYSRTGVFAFRPAPVQVNYLGFPGTLGSDIMDYLIADPILIPPEQKQYYDEKIAYLPHTYMVNDPTKPISDQSFSRAELGLPDDAFVFCSFNNYYKITPDLFDVWMRLLKEIEDSVLWLSTGNPAALKNLCAEAENRGISSGRLVFAPRMSNLADHLARHRQADLFLDTFSYNAHTTASDALWAGLPVLTCMGDTFPSRVAASLLNAVGLPELITHSHDEYESRALELAIQKNQLAGIRQKLAGNRTTQPLFDTGRFARHIEKAYTKMYERVQTGLPPDYIFIDA